MNSFSVYIFFALRFYAITPSKSHATTFHRLVILFLKISSCVYITAHVIWQYWLVPKVTVLFQTSYFILCMVNGLAFFSIAASNVRDIVEDSRLPHGIFVLYAAAMMVAYARIDVVFFTRDPTWFTGVRALLDICYQLFAINPLILYPWLVLNGSEVSRRCREENEVVSLKQPSQFKRYHAELVAKTEAFSRLYGMISVGTVMTFCWFIVFNACLVLTSKQEDAGYRSFLIVPTIYLTTSVILIITACDKFFVDGTIFRRALHRALLEEQDLAIQIDLRLLFTALPHPVPALPDGGSRSGLFQTLGSLLAYASLIATTPSMDTFQWTHNSTDFT